MDRRRVNVPFLGAAAALGSTAILTVWLLRMRAQDGIAWEASIIACVFALTHHLFLEWNGKTKGLDGPAAAATLSAGAPFVVLLFGSAMAHGAPPWPWIAAWIFPRRPADPAGGAHRTSDAPDRRRRGGRRGRVVPARPALRRGGISRARRRSCWPCWASPCSRRWCRS
jgi:hypothetical protein